MGGVGEVELLDDGDVLVDEGLGDGEVVLGDEVFEEFALVALL